MGFWIRNWLVRSENVQQRQGVSGLIRCEVTGRLQQNEAISGQNAIRRQSHNSSRSETDSAVANGSSAEEAMPKHQ